MRCDSFVTRLQKAVFVVFKTTLIVDTLILGSKPISILDIIVILGNVMFRSLFLLFLLIPLIEIYFLIQVGEVIGAGWTIFLVVATAVIGAGLLRMQGLSTLQRAQASMAQGQLPATAMFEGVALLLSGALLLTPGFFTDTIGFALLVPPIRQALIKNALKSGQFTMHGHSSGFYRSNTDSTIIDGEIVEDDDKPHLR
jgi:UPF0716 protein FxsA